MINNSKHNGTVLENLFCPVCNVHINMNKIKRFRSLDISQQHTAFSSDAIKEQCSSKDQLQTLSTNLHQIKDHSSEILIKLNPYLILDTDPTLDNLNHSNKLSRFPHSSGK